MQHKDAVREFKKSKNFKGLVLLKEQEGNYNDAVSLLVDNGKKDDALECAERYESEGHILRSDLQPSSLAIKFAKEICDLALTQKSRNRLAKLVRHMDNPTDRVNYLKIAKKYRDAFDVLCTDKKFDEAYRLCAAQGWTDNGLKLAEEKNDAKWVLQFTFQKAITGLITEDKVDSSIINRLHSLKNSDNKQVKAKAYLLLGKSDHDFFSCRTAFTVFLSTLNAAGCIEAFNLMIQFRVTGSKLKSTEINLRQTLDACSKATDISQTLERVLNYKPLSAAQEHALRQLEEVYGLQRHFSVAEKDKALYFLIPDQHIWIDLCRGHSSHEADVDSDGMIQIERTKTLRIINGHVQKFLKRWQEKDELQVCQIFRLHLSSFQFHKELEDRGCVRKSYKMQYQGRRLYEFLRMCYSGLELSKFANGEIKQAYVIQLLVNFFRPAAALYLGVTRGQMEEIARSSAAPLLAQHSLKIVEKSDNDFHADNWLDAWSILSILGKEHLDSLLKQLNKCAAHAKALPLNRMPAIYIRSRDAVGHEHIFSFWIRACSLIQSDRKVITSSKVVLHYFLETIIRTRSIRSTISVTSLINILTIYTTALLTLTALCNFMQRKPSNILIPNSYERVLNVFDNLGKQVNKDSIRVLDACMGDEKVLKAYEKMRSNQHTVQIIQKEITRLLWQILELLIGRHAHYFHPLRYAMKSEEWIKTGEARHCLLLVLVLFGNLSEIDTQCSPKGLQSYHNDINNAVEVLKDSIGEESQILRQACGMFSIANNTTGFFLAISHLITTVDRHDFTARINIRPQPNWRWDLERAQMRHFPARPLLPTAKSHQIQHSTHIVQPEGPSSTIERPGLLQQTVDSAFESAVPSHPASAYPAVTSSPSLQEESINPQQNVTTNAELPEAPTGRDAVQLLTSQASVEPQEEEESRVNFEEIEDEDLKNVTLSGPFVLDRQSSEITAKKENSSTNEDLSMVDKQFCRFCAVPLKEAEAAVPVAELEEGITDEKSDDQEPISEDQGDEVKAELYASHCDSEKHVNNVKAYENFTKVKTWYYDPLREMLSDVLQDLKRFESENIAPNLRITIQDIGRELEKDERTLSEIRNSAEWKVGASEIELDMLGRMDALITDAKDKLSKEQTRVQQLREQTTVHEEDEDNENNLDEDDGSQSEEEINEKVDPKEAKEKERQYKKNRIKAKRRGGKR
jgi:hypothetical protein